MVSGEASVGTRLPNLTVPSFKTKVKLYLKMKVKIEPLREDYSDGESVTAAQAELYTEHEIKQEVVVGPETIQPSDILQTIANEENEELPMEIKKVPCSCNRCNIQDNFTCDFCLNKHICKICNEHFEHQYQLKKHKSTHSGNRFLCTVCNKQFKQRSSLESHKWVHVTVRPFSCKLCHKSFKVKGTLTTHERTHTGDKPYICKICDKEFTQQTSLNNHMLLHKGIKPYPCPNCPQQFTQISNLRQHLRRFHSNDDAIKTSIILSKQKDTGTRIAKPLKLFYKL